MAGRAGLAWKAPLSDLTGNTPVILRPGGIPMEELAEILGENVVVAVFYDADSTRIGLAGIALRTCHPIGTLARRVAMAARA